MKKFIRYTLLFLLAGPVLNISSLQAQSLDEIIVTAQKREESIQDTPISMAAFGSEDLEQMGVVEIGNVSDYLVNVQIDKQSGSVDNYGYNIRGVGAFETNLLK